nr:hypothetical protein [Dyella sp. ASV24]
MALIECPDCKSSVSDAAPACPKCGRPIAAATSPLPPRTPVQRKRSQMLPALVVLIGGALLWGLWGAGRNTHPAFPDTPTITPPKMGDDQAIPASTPPAPPVIRINAPDLYAAYEANEVQADNLYKGRWLAVHGIVSSISKDFMDDPYLLLIGKNEYTTVHASFPKGALSELATLSKGTEVTVVCMGKGMIVTDPVLECGRSDAPPLPQSNPANPQPSPSKTPLTAAYAATTTDGASNALSSGSVDSPPPLPASTKTFPTSFDCGKAKSDAEHMICNDAVLAQNDRELAVTFLQAKAAANDQTAFKALMRNRWNLREQQCHDRACLIDWYAEQEHLLILIGQTGDVAGASP